MTALHKRFRERLLIAIQADGRRLVEIARASGYSVHHIYEVRRGFKTNPTLAFVETMAVTLEKSPAWMLGLEEEHHAGTPRIQEEEANA